MDFLSFLSSLDGSYQFPHYLGFGVPSGPDLFILLIIVLLLFGAKRLPEIAKSLGESVHEFKKATQELEKSETSASQTPAATPAATVISTPQSPAATSTPDVTSPTSTTTEPTAPTQP